MSTFYTTRYILVNKQVVPCSNLSYWAEWFDDINNRIVKQEEIGEYGVSTVFLGMEHVGGMFETMIFTEIDDELDQSFERSHTWDEAEKTHKRIVAEVRRKLIKLA